MTQPQKTGQETQDLSNAVLLDSSRRQFQAAWDEALNGGPEPQLETFLAGSSETDRVVLRLALEQIDREYRQRRGQVGQSTNDATIGFTAANASDTPEPSPDATVAFAPGQPPGLTPTVHISPGAPGDLAFVTDGNQGGAGRTAALADRRPEPSNLERPTVAGYDILGELGRGGMGVVYRAHHKKLSRNVALKMVLAGAHAGSEQLARFYTEAQAVAHVQHPNIVQIYEVGEQAGLPYFSLEFVDGGSLSQKMAGKPLPDQEAAALIETLARAMHHAHQNGIVHRDLKPANVLLTMSGVPKITDFGLAKRLEGESSSQTRSGAILGTPSYMAPEQAMGEVHQIGPLTDVYALGAMLYEMLTGRPPFLAATAMDTVLQVVRDEPVAPTQLQPKVPADLETICLKCLQKEQPKRYATAEALAEDLRRFLAGEPILARPISAPERLWRWCRRNPKIATLSVVVVTLLVLCCIGSSIAAYTIAQERDEKENQRKEAETAKELADVARKEAVKHEAQAKEAEKRATRNAEIAAGQRKLALDTLYSVVTKVDEQLRDRDDMQNLRQELIKDAMDGLRRVEDSDATNSLVDRSLGVGHQRNADIIQQMGRTEDALNEHKRALEIFERLLLADPQDHWARWDAALSYDKLGDLTRLLGSDAATVREYYEKALKHREALPPHLSLDELTPARIQQSLVNSYAKLYSVSLSLGDVVGARDYLRKTLDYSEALAAANPGNPQAKQALSGANLLLGRLSFRLREIDAAIDYYHNSLKLRQELLVSDPLSVNYRRLIAATYDAIGDVYLQLSRDPQAAEAQYAKAKELYQQLYSKNAKDADSQAGLASSQYRMGTALLLQSRRAEAEQEFLPCLKLREDLVSQDPKNTNKQVQLIHALARVGQHAAAFDVAEELRERVQKDPDMLYNLVCGYALCAAALANGKPPDDLSADDRNLFNRYSTLALDTLKQAIAQGYNNLTQIDTDPELEAIRASDTFDEIRRGLQR